VLSYRPVSIAAQTLTLSADIQGTSVSAKAIQVWGGVEVYLHSFLISASDGGEWSNLNANRLAAGDRTQVSGSIPAAIRKFCSRETSSAYAGIQTTTALSASSQSAGHRSCLFIYCLFNDAAGSCHHTASNGRRIRE